MSALAVRLPARRRFAPRLLPSEPTPSYREHLERYGPPARLSIDEVERSGLTGRGGAGFPTAVKLRTAAGARSPIVVANGTEGEPLSAKDATLLRLNPHLVLDGVAAAARAVGAKEAIVAVGAASVDAVRAALRHRPPSSPAIRIATPPERFVAGEESALLNFLRGGPAKPTAKRPFEQGVLVQNVETLAQLALIARFGADWFRQLGTDQDPGTALVTLTGAVARPGVLEAAMGTPVVELVRRRGGLTAEPRALLVGGYFGTWRRQEELTRPLDRSFGARMIAVLPRGRSGIGETTRILRYLADESAGQCGPCVFGLRALADEFESIEGARFERLRAQIERRGACAHPDGAVRLAASALELFADEVA